MSFPFSFGFDLSRVSFLPRILHRTFPHVKHRTGMIMMRACFHHAHRPRLVRTGRHTCSLSHPTHPDTPLPVSLSMRVSSPSAIAQTHPFVQSHLGWATGHREERNTCDGPMGQVESGEFLLRRRRRTTRRMRSKNLETRRHRGSARGGTSNNHGTGTRVLVSLLHCNPRQERRCPCRPTRIKHRERQGPASPPRPRACRKPHLTTPEDQAWMGSTPSQSTPNASKRRYRSIESFPVRLDTRCTLNQWRRVESSLLPYGFTSTSPFSW